MLTLIEKYQIFISVIEEEQSVLKSELLQLGAEKHLSKDDRRYMNELMDYIGYGNLTITNLENTIRRLKREEDLKEGV